MRSLLLNSMFLLGSACIVWSTFIISFPLGLLTIGLPCVAVSIQLQRKAAKAKP